jgi:signal peptidase I
MTPNSDASDRETDRKEGFMESIKTVVYAVLIAVVIRTLAYEPFNIPSGSMLPTLLIGDYVFVAKFPYGYSKHSMPWSPPLFDGRIWESPVERGDVAVFKLPTDNSTDYIKRIVGLPGDRIQMIHGVLHINGAAVKRERVDDFLYTDIIGRLARIPQYRETLPNGVSYMTLDIEREGSADNTAIYTVPEGHYFAMGDNRDDSTDSRFLNHVGFVPAENVVGRAEFLFFSVDGSASWWQVWKWPTVIRYSRLLNSVD